MNDNPKFWTVMPLQAKLLLNSAIETGEALLIWLGKFQGQLNYRLQKFFNSDQPIKDPKFVRYYQETETEIKGTSDSPVLFSTFKINVPKGFEGQYLLTVNGIVGSSNSSINLFVYVRVNDEIVPVPVVLRSFNESSRLPFIIRREVSVKSPNTEIKVLLSCDRPTFNKGDITGYFCSIELTNLV